jgi:hypothetical protein
MKMSKSRLGSSKSSFRNLSTNVWQLKKRKARFMGKWITDPEQRRESVTGNS